MTATISAETRAIAIASLDKTREWLEDEARWHHYPNPDNSFGLRKDNTPLYVPASATDENVYCLCIMGAFYRAVDRRDDEDAVDLAEEALNHVAAKRLSPTAILATSVSNAMAPTYNDLETTTHADILSLIDEAKAELAQAGA